ncbi:hypothetical protein [Alkalicoccobacillus plakortidis]|uniref:YhfM-like domain-containing protein n=1 Tax=Alkalicoccobacillus plakortidis TaxID=444060 RepID=A0ABT0XI97_9BACI|nr:hypothetical protein [Alkalicoccobacillus plakortidis]MCM2675073.1 hypothetical protein [Alkalicoccobacillus plakortidis]
MRNRFICMISILIMLLLFSGCQADEPAVLSVGDDINKIIVSKMKGTDEKIFEDTESIDAFELILTSAVKDDGIVNMAQAEYKVDFYQDETKQQSLWVWIGEQDEKGVFMKPEDTHTTYSISVEENNKLVELVGAHFN